MAIFRKGVKIGKFDMRMGLTKGRAKGITDKIGITESPKTTIRPEGEIDAIRTMVGKAEGFMRPVNFKITFQVPRGIEQPKYDATLTKKMTGGANSGMYVGEGTLDWKTHKLQGSDGTAMQASFKEQTQVSETKYTPFKTTQRGSFIGGKMGGAGIGDTLETMKGGGGVRQVRKLDLFCSKVLIPEKTYNVGLYRTYGAPYPYPQSVQFGTITTTFYCDGAMGIKKFFDQWQKLIWNDMTGNFNYYDEYVSEFDVFTRSSVMSSGNIPSKPPELKGSPDEFPKNVLSMINNTTKAFDEFTGAPTDPPKNEKYFKPAPKTVFANTYGIKVLQCWPQTVGSISLAHDATDQIGTFDVTWAYTKWNPFKLGDIGDRSTVPLSIGEFRNEKDGFPFLEDMPPELSGPLTGALGQAVTTGPLSHLSNLLG